MHTTGQLATVGQVTLSVTNNTGDSVRPAFTLENGTVMTAFWQRVSGPAVLGPHQHASVHDRRAELPGDAVHPERFPGAGVPHRPGVGQPHVRLPGQSTGGSSCSPTRSTRPCPSGQQITVRAEIVNRLDQPVAAAAVPVYLGQIIYAQQGLRYSQAFINNGLEGQTPVEALTNKHGVATFKIRSPVGGSDPVYFEANLVNPTYFYPYGYSPILTVRFGS